MTWFKKILKRNKNKEMAKETTEVVKKEKKKKFDADKKLEKFQKKYKKATKKCNEDVEVITLERDKHFKKELSTTQGFGFQDLKKGPRLFIAALMSEGYDLVFTPLSGSKDDFSVKVTAKK